MQISVSELKARSAQLVRELAVSQDVIQLASLGNAVAVRAGGEDSGNFARGDIRCLPTIRKNQDR